MLSKKKAKKVLVSIIGCGFLVLFVGCGWNPSPEQIKQMEDTRQAALSAEQKVEDLKSQRKQKEDVLAGKQRKVQSVKGDKADVDQRVKNLEGN